MFDNLLSKKEDYVECPYYEFGKYLNLDYRKICIDISGQKSLYAIDLLKSVIDKDNLGLSLYQKDLSPLMLSYQYGDLDVYAVVAPLIDDPLDKCDIICRLPF